MHMSYKYNIFIDYPLDFEPLVSARSTRPGAQG
jgi:hypothetical protein